MPTEDPVKDYVLTLNSNEAKIAVSSPNVKGIIVHVIGKYGSSLNAVANFSSLLNKVCKYPTTRLLYVYYNIWCYHLTQYLRKLFQLPIAI